MAASRDPLARGLAAVAGRLGVATRGLIAITAIRISVATRGLVAIAIGIAVAARRLVAIAIGVAVAARGLIAITIGITVAARGLSTRAIGIRVAARGLSVAARRLSATTIAGVRELTHVVTSREVVAHEEVVAIAGSHGTTDRGGVGPHDLGVVAISAEVVANGRARGVVLLLVHPQVEEGNIAVAGASSEVLTKLNTRIQR